MVGEATGDGDGPGASTPSGDDGTDGDGVGESETTYGGLLGAYPYAFRASDSLLFEAYVVVGGLLAVVLLLAFAVSIVVVFSNTLGAVGGTFTFSRAFVAVVGLLVAAPVLAPVLLVARRHRRTRSTERYDTALAAAGFLYSFAIYLALVVSAPPDMRTAPSGPTAPAVEFLYGLPQVAGLVPPLLAVGLMYLLHRRYRAVDSPADAAEP